MAHQHAYVSIGSWAPGAHPHEDLKRVFANLVFIQGRILTVEDMYMFGGSHTLALGDLPYLLDMT